jgi:hypothetical protein
MKQIVLIAFLAAAPGSQAVELRDFDIGVRVGTSMNDRTETFRQVEGTVDYRLPWHWEWESGFHVESRLDFSAGWLHGEGQEAAVATLGPTAVLGWKELPLTLDIGSSPTLLSRHHFGNRDFGGLFQFTTHIGLNWELLPHFQIGYRYQHMSNAGLFTPNPGLNLHMLGLSYQF